MWSQPRHLCVVGTARPLRVAYLIDPANCPAGLLDAIIAEAYGRWGGRRTLIVPGNQDGVDPRYREWLWYYDADVIYSFIDLVDPAVAKLNQRYAPARLVRHDTFRRQPGEPAYLRINMPLQGLSCLSVLPALLSRSWGLGERIASLRILDKYFDRSESSFLTENFGFVSQTFNSALLSRQCSERFNCLTLISPEALGDPRIEKDPSSKYETDESGILEALGNKGPLMTLAQLSESFAPYLDTGRHDEADGLSIVAGDSIDDRILFWNHHHRYANAFWSDITSLRVPGVRLSDTEFLTRLKAVILRRGKRDSQGQPRITLRSCSIERDQLEHAAQILRTRGSLSAVAVACHSGHSDCVPTFQPPVHYRRALAAFDASTDTAERAEFAGNRVSLPNSMPWHMREALPPYVLRDGNWMVDLAIDGPTGIPGWPILGDTLVLPRRLRLEGAFTLEQSASESWAKAPPSVRVNRAGMLSVSHSFGQDPGVLTIPDALDAFERGLCNPFEWAPFDRTRKDAPHGLPRYRYAEPSDKGRYLLAVLERFVSVSEAFDVLMNEYWRGVLQNLGAVAIDKSAGLCYELIRTLRKRLRCPKGDLVFSGPEEERVLAKEMLRAGNKLRRERRYIRYDALWERWTQEPFNGSQDEGDAYVAQLDQWLTHLCQREILFQGQEWSCRKCLNRNWVAIDQMKKMLTCEVCGREEPPPVSGIWQFRANHFLVEAYRDHGVEAVIWTLWQLFGSAKRSFYFAPSMKLWDEWPDQSDARPAEVDALVVVDGTLYLCEAKSSAGLTSEQADQLIRVADKIQPDVLLIACMDTLTKGMKNTVQKIQVALGEDVRVKLRGIRPDGSAERWP